MKTIASACLAAAILLGVNPNDASANFRVCNNSTWTVSFIWYRGSVSRTPCPNNFEVAAWTTVTQHSCKTLSSESMNGLTIGWWATVVGGSGQLSGAPVGASEGSPGSSSGEQWYPVNYNFDACYDGSLFGNRSLCESNWRNGVCRQLVGSKFKVYNNVDVQANFN
jgi:hypothetical protein